MFTAVAAKPTALVNAPRHRGAARTRRSPAAAKCQAKSDESSKKNVKSTSADGVVTSESLFASRRNALMAMTLAPALFLNNPDVVSAAVSKVSTPDERCAACDTPPPPNSFILAKCVLKHFSSSRLADRKWIKLTKLLFLLLPPAPNPAVSRRFVRMWWG
jgi:hypothetical protein